MIVVPLFVKDISNHIEHKVHQSPKVFVGADMLENLHFVPGKELVFDLSQLLDGVLLGASFHS